MDSHIQSLLFFLTLCIITIVECDVNKQEGWSMESDMQKVENIRVQFESRIMGIEGVVGVGTGLCNDKPCLKIYTSVPTQQVRSNLPEELKKIDIELEFVGEIKAE